MVGWAVEGRAGGPWVSPDRVAGRRLSSQIASELLLAALSVCFPAKVQLRGARASIRPGPPPTPPQINQSWDRTGEMWGVTACTLSQLRQHQTLGQRQLRRGARTLPAPPTLSPTLQGSKATATPISPCSLCTFTPKPLPTPGKPYKDKTSHTLGSRAGVPQAPHFSPTGRQVGGGWARAEQGAGHHGDKASGFLLPALVPGSQAPRRFPGTPCPHPALQPLGHSLGPRFAGLVVPGGEVTQWARSTVCTTDSSTDLDRPQPPRQLGSGAGHCLHPRGLPMPLSAHMPPRP